MAIPLVVNGVTFQYPVQFDKNWGPTLTAWSQAVTNGMLQKAGGSFPLTAEVDFGASFGMKVLSIKSEESNIATTGILRLANASTGIAWRNAANSANLALTVNASNQLTFNGTSIGATTSLTSGHILVGNVSNQPADVAMSGDTTIDNTGAVTIANSAITNAKVSASAAIARTKLATASANTFIVNDATGQMSQIALNAAVAVVTDSSGLPASSATTATEIGRLSGVTSSVQTQLNSMLQKAGGTMSGVLNMGSNKIQAVTPGAAAGEAATYDQLQQFMPTGVILPYGGTSAPTGYLLCNGSAVSRSTYSALFAIVGTAFGVGDGSTTFNVPSMANNVPVGAGGAIAASVGSTGGASTSAHTHGLATQTIQSGGTGISNRIVCGASGSNTAATAYNNGAGSNLGQGIGSDTASGSTSTVQPSVGVTYIIKT